MSADARFVFVADGRRSAEEARDAAVAALHGRRLTAALVGQMFTCDGVELQLVDVVEDGVVVRADQVVVRPAAAAPTAAQTAVAAQLRDQIGDFVRDLRIVSEGAPDAAAALREHAQLVETPKDAVVAELEALLRPPDWIRDWSEQHYGREIVAASLLRGRPPLAILEGEPGTGKTATARSAPHVLVRRLGEPLLFVQLNDRLRGQGIQGRAGTDLARVFETIAEAASRTDLPALVFLDEAEGVASVRDGTDLGSGAQENVALVDALIVSIDALTRRADARLAFAMATNLVSRLDPAIVRRGSVFHFARPTKAARMELLGAWLAELGLSSRDLARLDGCLDGVRPVPTASDVLQRVIAPVVHASAREGQPIVLDALMAAARGLVPTPASP